MGVEEAAVNSIMSGIENTGRVKQHNHKKKLRQRFDIIKKLGQGTFGKVQLGINKETGQEVAIKTIKKSKIESDADLVRIRREIQIMSSVQHPNIIHIYEVFENREKMVLVMEYAAGGELYDYLSERKVLLEDEARRIFRQIATACYYCHKHKICHRDLKLENILLDENNNAKIADFGLSNVFDDQRLLSTFCGSPLYASPEIVKGTPYHGPEVDCWSLGVLLYTLVYGAMPFDGSNFKRLVKQISQGDYFEPPTPSPASPLIRDMLTVNPKKRADIEKICSHWWVNETYTVNCLEISEELANQTPVRLDVLLSLAPPAPQLESEKLVVTEEATGEGKQDAAAPLRSQSVGSLMDLTVPERRIMDMINEEKFASKRKLEGTLSTDRMNLDKRREKIIKENTVADITVHGAIQEDVSQEDVSMTEPVPLNKSLTQTISKEKVMDVEHSLEGAACQEILEEVREKEGVTANRSSSVSKIKKTPSSVDPKVLKGINELSVQENIIDKENKAKVVKEETVKKTEDKPTTKTRVVKKKVLSDKNENGKDVKTEESSPTKEKQEVKENGLAQDHSISEDSGATKPVERRKSRIFEAAEKFQNLLSPTETKPAPIEKPKKIVLPDRMVTQQGVSVDGFKKEFERKSSLTSSTPVKPKSSTIPKRTFLDKPKPDEKNAVELKKAEPKVTAKQESSEETKQEPEPPKETPPKTEEVRHDKVKNAVNIISNALDKDKDGTRKSKSRPSMMKKPPVPFGVSGRSASGNIGTIPPLSPPIQNMGPKPFLRPCYENKIVASEAKQLKEEPSQPSADEPQTSNAEITLKSATLPRRKTTKAQIQINYPAAKPAQMEFHTEAAHNVEAPAQVRSEVVVPISGAVSPSTDIKGKDGRSSKERIIPIAFEKKLENASKEPDTQSPPVKPPMARPFQTQKSNVSQRSTSLSRQSTQDSDSESTSTGEPIKKSTREYIIPIAVEGGGYVTPRAGSLEPSDSNASTMTNRSKFSRGPRRLNSRLSDRESEDESPFASLHRHSSFGKDSDNEDSGKAGNFHHMHRLRRIRPKKTVLEHNDSVSSGEEDDDDEGFEILTAENLFSTLLSRVRDLTQRLNVDDGVRPGFPSSRLLSHFDHGLWNRMENPLSRHTSLSRTFGRPSSVASTQSNSSFNVPWRRSVSKDLASDIETVFNDQNSGTLTARIPRGDNNTLNDQEANLNLAELDLQKLNLSEEDRLALSHLTPGLSRRIERQLMAQLTPAEVRKLHRTLSTKTSDEINKKPTDINRRKSLDRISCPLPRKAALSDGKTQKSLLPVKFNGCREEECRSPSYDFNVRSSSIGAQPTGTGRFCSVKPRVIRSNSRTKPDLYSPESSLSESLSKTQDTSGSYRKDTDSYSSRYSDNSLLRPCTRYYSDVSPSYSPSPVLLSPTRELPSRIERKPSPRKVSRFLRPDFYENKEDNVLVKEKKERERETQQVLKEIRDKRKSRFRTQSRNSEEKKEEVISTNDQADLKVDSESKITHDYVNVPASSSDFVEPVHDYVNVKIDDSAPVLKKVSKIARPKSYPSDNIQKSAVTEEPKAAESKIGKLKKGFKKQPKEDKSETNKHINAEEKSQKNKLLQTLEKKLEKFRNAQKNPEEVNMTGDKKSVVDSAIKRLREQSLPRNLETCTESGLIKRAVSVEDLAVGSKPLQASKKSVTKILGLFKKYEDQDKKKDKTVKKTKSKARVSDNREEPADGGNEKKERPKSLLLEKVKHFQNGCKTPEIQVEQCVNNDDRPKSKLPVINAFRRSLNLEHIREPPEPNQNESSKLDRGKLRLELNNTPSNVEVETVEEESGATQEAAYLSSNEKRNSVATTDDSSTVLSPTDDYLSCDSWSACTDYCHLNDLHSPQYNGHVPYSGDESESVIDRIRRKSFYTRFNEKKKPTRRPLGATYKNADLSMRDYGREYSKPDYSSLDRYRSPSMNRRTFTSYIPEVGSSSTRNSKEYLPYTRSASVLNDYVNVPSNNLVHTYQNVPGSHSSLIGHSYQNIPGSYQTYSSRIARPSKYSDSDSRLDDFLTTSIPKRLSPYKGTFDRSPLSRSSAILQSPSTSEPI